MRLSYVKPVLTKRELLSTITADGKKVSPFIKDDLDAPAPA